MYSVKVHIENKTSFPISKKAVEAFAKSVLKELKSFGELSIVFVDDKKILELNKKYLKRDRPTNVLAFPFPEIDLPDGVERRIIGDIVISIDRARDEAKDSNLNLRLLQLITHGILHLHGWDDKTEDEDMEMEKEEIMLISKFYKNIITEDGQKNI